MWRVITINKLKLMKCFSRSCLGVCRVINFTPLLIEKRVGLNLFVKLMNHKLNSQF
jgi:hypothetical protein